jgi:hypothetical protein
VKVITTGCPNAVLTHGLPGIEAQPDGEGLIPNPKMFEISLSLVTVPVAVTTSSCAANGPDISAMPISGRILLLIVFPHGRLLVSAAESLIAPIFYRNNLDGLAGNS